uniref:Uncharacterized protein n=1 Tax=Tanacetum cinerariifolium TaxID=118510 RepID=A0A699REE8_TANCI|nr:hypothetical protein [Tanacetum cinerariifolium]GFC86822.1 hypothetical protein [Tanacetum cinerariifolium]
MFDRYKTEKKMEKIFKENKFRMNGHEYDITALDTAVRKNISDHSEMKKFVLGLSRQFNELKEHNCWAERLSRWEAWVRGRIPAQDAAMAAREDGGDDITTPRDSQPFKPRGYPRDSQ